MFNNSNELIMSKRLFSLALCLLIGLGTAFAQTIKVSGTVTDNNGEPVVSAAVQLKGSTNVYTMTDAVGEFSLSVPGGGTLAVSCLGFTPAEVPVNGRSNISIQLKPDSQVLEDVIVVAYGTVRREANTGSVTSVKNEQLAQVPATSVDKMLAGKMAGVSITSGSGQPGSTSTIRVRGTSSINAGNEPLWVVDGIPVMSSDGRTQSNMGVGGGSAITFLNPNDIESITVLKDAAAASVYGSRAANGVILVTTKSGKSGQARFTARAKFGAQQLINDNNYRPLTGQELLAFKRDCAINAGYNPDDPTSQYYYPQTLLANGTTNWYKELTKIGSIQEYEINAAGGTDKASYYSSVAYHKNDGVFYGVDFQRFTARVNADMKLTRTLKGGAKFNLSYSDSNSGQMGDLYYSNPQMAMFSILPWTPFRNEDGSYNTVIQENSNTNPRANAAYEDNNDKDYRLQGTMFLEWKPISQLTFKTNNSVEFDYVDSRQYRDPRTHQGTATLFTYWNKDIRYTTSNTITYDDKFGDHSLRLLAGQEAMYDKVDLLGGYSPNVDPAIPYPSTGVGDTDQVDFGLSEESLLSFFGVADYNYLGKYYFQGSVRADGSSLFGANNKWGVFWSVSGSWNINREKWMAFSKDWLSALKVRASYGVNGNNNIAAYRAYGTYSSITYAGKTGMVPARPENPNLSWEKNKTWDVGVDFGFFDDRLTGSADVYYRKTTDMLLSKRVPYTTGFGTNFMNVGAIRNKGIEFQLEGVILNGNDWNWTAGFNIALNRSKVIDIADSEYLTVTDDRARQNDSTPVRIAKGRRLYTFYTRDYYGVNPSNGEPLWYDKDGKLTSELSKARYIYAGTPEPKATGGFNTTLSWKGLSLSAYFEFVAGNKVFVAGQADVDGASMNSNTTTASLNYWKKPGDTGVRPKPIAGQPNSAYAASTRNIQDGSYTRIKDITLSYSLPEKILKPVRMKGVRIYVSALNPYTFHHVKGVMDPELGVLGYTMGASHTMVKSFVGGVEVSF